MYRIYGAKFTTNIILVGVCSKAAIGKEAFFILAVMLSLASHISGGSDGK